MFLDIFSCISVDFSLENVIRALAQFPTLIWFGPIFVRYGNCSSATAAYPVLLKTRNGGSSPVYVTGILLTGRDAKFTATVRYITSLWNLQICNGW